MLHGGFQAVRQALLDAGAHHQPIHHQINLVLFLFIQDRRVLQLVHFPIDAGPDEAVLAGVLHQLHVLALPGADHRGQDLDALTLWQRSDGVHHLIDRLLFDLFTALGAVGDAGTGIQKAQVVMDLRHRAHGGARVLGGGFLVNGNGGRQAFDAVHVGLVHLAQEHAGIAGHALHIPPLALCVDRVKREGGFA